MRHYAQTSGQAKHQMFQLDHDRAPLLRSERDEDARPALATQVSSELGQRIAPGGYPDGVLIDDDVLAWHQAVTPKPHLISQLVDFRLMMEPKAAMWAAEIGSKSALDEVKRAHLKMEKRRNRWRILLLPMHFFTAQCFARRQR